MPRGSGRQRIEIVERKNNRGSRNDVMAEPDKKSILRFTLFIRQALGNGSISQAIITVAVAKVAQGIYIVNYIALQLRQKAEREQRRQWPIAKF